MEAQGVPSGLSQLRLHQHACQIEASREVELATAAAYLRHGLECGEVCLYVRGDADDSARVRAALAAAGVGPEAEREGRLRIVGPGAFQLRRSPFDPEEMLGFVREQVAGVRAAGFPGLRVVADMTWTLVEHPGSDRFLEFESRVDEVFHDLPLAALCQYRTSRLGPAVVHGALLTHPRVVARGALRDNPSFVPPEEFLRREDLAARVDRLLAAMPAARPGDLVTICAWCKAVGSGGDWERLEEYASRKLRIELTHGICPACDRRLAAGRN
jgi:hypothetical protein